MMRNLLDWAENTGALILAAATLALAALAVYAVLAYGGVSIAGDILPRWMGVQRRAVEQSKSFTDSRNDAMLNLKREYEKLPEAEIGQRQAIFDQVCGMVDTMAADTVAPAVTRWTSENGGCE